HADVGLDRLSVDDLTQELQRLRYHRAEVDRRDRRPALAREIQHLPDDLRDAIDLAGDDAGVARDLGGIARALALAESARPPADHVQRRADLVRDLSGHLADRRQFLRLAQAGLQRQARL